MNSCAGTIAEQDRIDEVDGVGSAALDKEGLLSQLQQEMQPCMQMGQIPLELSLATQYTPNCNIAKSPMYCTVEQ